MTGTIFDIEEGSIYGSENLGITIYFKGCPLKCKMCHSPEGQSVDLQDVVLSDGTHKTIGKIVDSKDLAKYMNKMHRCMDISFVFSGGEPLLQGRFILEVISMLDDNVDIVLDTSGYCIDKELFCAVVSKMSFINFSLKLVDAQDNKDYTGQSSYIQLRNLFLLDRYLSTKYQLVIPLIPDVIDTKKNLEKIDLLASKLKRCEKTVFNPFNIMTFAKKQSFKIV